KRGLLTDAELRERGPARRAPGVAGSAYFHSPRLRARLVEAAARAGVRLHLGVLMGSLGPSYESAAEVRMGTAFGADAACMSTVQGGTLASELGCEAASISCVTTRATGLAEGPLTHQEVTQVAERGARSLALILDHFLAARDRGGRDRPRARQGGA